MSKKGITKTVITVSIDTDLEQKLRELAKSENRSFSQVVEWSILQTISNPKVKDKPLSRDSARKSPRYVVKDDGSIVLAELAEIREKVDKMRSELDAIKSMPTMTGFEQFKAWCFEYEIMKLEALNPCIKESSL